MNKVQQSIYDKIVSPAMKSIAGAVMGTVISFDSINHLATVEYSSGDMFSTQKVNVPYNVTPGIKKSALYPGDTVLLIFLNNSYKRPVILDILDREHALQTWTNQDHTGKGSNISDYYSEREGESWDVG
jgi:hypothetical protein